MSRLVIGLAVAALAVSAGAAAAHDEGYGGGYGNGYGNGYGEDQGRYDRSAYSDQSYGYGYGEDVTARARYCREHAEFHRRQAEALSRGALNDAEWREWNERAHAQFHYSHPGSWRCDFLPNGGAD